MNEEDKRRNVFGGERKLRWQAIAKNKRKN